MERWRITLYTIWFSQIISLMSFGFGIPFLPYYIQELGVTNPDKLKIYTGILNAAPAITMAIMAPVWGILSDKFGKKLMLLRAMFFAAFILAGMGLATRVEHLVLLRLAQGVFTGTITASAALIASNTPNNRLSYALGFLSSSTFIGYSLGPVIGGVIAEYVGYRPSFFIGGALMMLDFILVYFAAYEDKMSIPKIKEEKLPAVPIIKIFSSITIIMLFILFFTRISRTVFTPYIPLYVQEVRSQIEGSAGTTGIINGVTGFMTALSGITLSRIGDQYNKRTLIIVLTILSIVMSLPLIFIKNIWIFTALYGLFFFVIGGIEPIATSITSEQTPSDRRGMLFGVQGLVGSLGWVAAPTIASVISIKYSLTAIILIIPVTLIFTLITIMMVKKAECK